MTTISQCSLVYNMETHQTYDVKVSPSAEDLIHAIHNL